MFVRTISGLAGAGIIALIAASPALAARASVTFGCCSDPSVSMTGPGFATAEKINSKAFGQANAYEFSGGVGVFAFAASTGSNGSVPQATAEASFSKTFRVGTSANSLYRLYEEDDGVLFRLAFTISPSGSVSVSTQNYRPGLDSYAGAYTPMTGASAG